MVQDVLKKGADNVRILSAVMVEKAKSGHPGGAMGGADFINALYSKYIVTDPTDAKWFSRDRFFLDPGHMSAMLYSVLALTGKFKIEELQQFRQWGSATPGHPELSVDRGIENTSGPLGQGHVMAVGAAIAERFMVERFSEVWAHKTYAFISDGGIQEEISQGAGNIAGHLGLENLIMFYDSNDVQLSTKVEDVSSEDTAAKYRAWNWNVIEINGNDTAEILSALEQANKPNGKPTLIIGKTVMGVGCVKSDGSSFEGEYSTHGQPLSAAGVCVEKTIEKLGGDAQNPWVIFDEVAELYQNRAEELKSIVAVRKAQQAEWAEINPELAAQLQSFINNELPEIDYTKINYKPNSATRSTSAEMLSIFGEKVKNMIVSSADLANSDKTEAFLKKVGAINKHDFAGAFLHAGVSELTMASIMNGIVLHGGMFVACGTFFVFSDYMKPAIRMSALMRLPVKFVWTHDAFRVGEDGPTHQPIEQEAQIRLMEQVKNHKGENSMLVIRPADAAETVVAWQMAMENMKTPTGLILSRQDIKDVPSVSGDRLADAQGAKKGAYVVYKDENPDLVLLGNGSEVTTLCDAYQLIKDKGIKVQIVSVPSVGLFQSQSAEYKNQVLPSNVPVFGLTAGLPNTLQSLVGCNGFIFGLDHFGESAPFKVLEQKFGFTAEAVAVQIESFIAVKGYSKD
ncbi:MAG: transketolase [Bacteroidales bacterium]